MKKRVLGILLATYLGAAMLTGCSQTESTDGESTAAGAGTAGPEAMSAIRRMFSLMPSRKVW